MDNDYNFWLLGGGLLSGLIMGAVVQRSNFCMTAAISNLVLIRDFRQLHAYLAAVTVAILGTQTLDLTGVIALSDSAYRATQVDWFGAVLGGILFGFGTMLSGGCIGKTIVRLGEGNLSALIVLIVMGTVGAVTMYGGLEQFRLWLREITIVTINASDTSLSSLLHLSSIQVAIVIASFCIAIILLTGKNSFSPVLISAGAIIGLLVVLGWWVTGYLSQDIFSIHRPSSISYAGPAANLTMMLSSGSSLSMGAQFGIALFIGTMMGATINAVFSNTFHWILPESHHVVHLIFGGALMGFGAILAGGCNVGQGLSGISTFSVWSLIALVAIVIGMRLGLSYLLLTETNFSEKKSSESLMHKLLHH
jgi:uncharacterized membrane protein YedE/YeeE